MLPKLCQGAKLASAGMLSEYASPDCDNLLRVAKDLRARMQEINSELRRRGFFSFGWK